MRKSEFVAIAAASVIAGCSLYSYEQNQTRTVETRVEEEKRKQIQSRPISDGKSVGKAPDFSAYKDVNQKKQAFFDYLRPGIALENKRVAEERVRLEQIEQRFEKQSISTSDQSYAKRLGKLYNVELPANGVEKGWLDVMLHRVDVIPEALVLVQGANESAWGTSRFATEANNYFGQWCYSQGCGLIPLQRGAGMTHEVAKFSSVQQSIHGYFMNVNRNRAYEALRDIRYQRHINGQSLTDTDAALALSNGLLKYSERGEAYVNDLQSMIRHNTKFWQSPLANQ
ncbi:glucosaminidase [Vibrio aquaticus]|uniref:Glucosaminidase n=1 Tax=Vibrio aquaticus TaxID=2496559 RepID=A0A432CZB0_9VIBR|nr:glucosaminidase domain-containing protein [Vibrio aquaticus]RTZ16946.1 glucosaminidase [Vibrio aquaticus]